MKRTGTNINIVQTIIYRKLNLCRIRDDRLLKQVLFRKKTTDVKNKTGRPKEDGQATRWTLQERELHLCTE